MDILIHKNTYTKIQSALTYGFIQNADRYSFQILNCHNAIYDLYYAYKPKKILLQIEEYSNEFHALVHDDSIELDKILLSVDNNIVNYDTYIKILQQIRSPKVYAIAHQSFIDYAQNQQKMMSANFIPYNNLVNKYVFHNKNMTRNNKILCILSSDKECIKLIDKFLYPNSKMPIVLINNPEILHDQNIGLMLDDDLNTSLNTFDSVIDLTLSYDAEISVCGIPKYSMDQLESLDTAKPSCIEVATQDAGEFVVSKLMDTNNE